MKQIPRRLLELIKWDIRGVIATLVALAVLIGLGWAANNNPLYTFDFGTASLNDLQPGAIHVKGAVSLYPKQSEGLLFGWGTSDVQEFTDKSVSNKLNMDYNGSSASSTNNFKIRGLEPGAYRFRFTVGSLTNTLFTRLQIGSQAKGIAAGGGWQTGDIVHETLDGAVEIEFSSIDGMTSWGVSALQIFAAESGAPEPSFELSITPSSHRVTAGGTAVFNVGLTPVNNYAGSAELSISGLVSGISAQFVPPTIVSLPGSSALQISTNSNAVPITYEFLVQAIGTGGDPVKRSGAVSVAVTSSTTSSGTTTEPDSDSVVGDSTGDTTPSIIDLPPRTKDEVEREFALVDEFAKEEEAKLLHEKEFLELEEIGYGLAAVPIYTEMPEPKTAFEGVLQGMVQSGIIQSTVDVAQPAQPDREGFWSRFMKTLFPPVM